MKLIQRLMHPRRNLLGRMMGANVILFLSVTVPLVALFLITQHRAIEHQLKLRAESLCRSLESQIEFPMLVGNREDLERIANAAVQDEDIAYVRIVDSSGAILAEAGRGRTARLSSPLLVGGTPRIVESARQVVPHKESTLLDWQGGDKAGSALGIVSVAFSLERQQALFWRTAAAAAGVAAFALFSMIGAAYLQLRHILMPLKQLIEFTRLVGKGDLSQRAAVPRVDEVGDLAASFNHMVDELDISRRELMLRVDEAQAASRLKSEFLANMSHEIRTPMNGIIGMTNLALEMPMSPEQKQCLVAVRESADSLLTVINDILDLSKIEAGKLSLDTIEFDLDTLLRQVMATLAPRAHEKNLELLCEPAMDIPSTLVGDPVRLRQVLMNLAGNAIKFTECGEVVVSVTAEAAAPDVLLTFTITNTGIGIAHSKLKSIFDAFVQADGSTCRKYGGAGLGLTICSSLVAMMGGEVMVDSEPGRGSRFRFTARLGCVESPVTSTRQSEALRGVRMLLVDDNASSRRILAAFAAHFGFRIQSSPDGITALAQLAEAATAGDPYRLLLVDAGMAEIDGFALAQRVKRDETPACARCRHDRHPGPQHCRESKPRSRSLALLVEALDALRSRGCCFGRARRPPIG